MPTIHWYDSTCIIESSYITKTYRVLTCLFIHWIYVTQGEEVTLISSYSLGGLC